MSFASPQSVVTTIAVLGVCCQVGELRVAELGRHVAVGRDLDEVERHVLAPRLPPVFDRHGKQLVILRLAPTLASP